MAFSFPLEVRFRDMDALGHVNHAVFVTYLEHVRTQWWRTFLQGRTFREAGFLIARVEVDYRAPVVLGDAVRAELRVAAVGGTSFTLGYTLLRGDTVLAEARTVQVMLDFESGRPKPVDPALRAWLESQA